MAFDPDAYLSKTPSSFNPDEYLGIKAPKPEEQSGLPSVAPRAANTMTADEYRAQVAAREAKGYDRTLGGTAIDTGVTLLKGAIGLPEAFVGLADIPTLGYAGKLLEEAGYKPKEAKAILDTYLSEAQQFANRQVKETKGFLPTVGAALQNPSTIVTAVGESLPQMIGGAGIARGIVKAAPGVAPYIAGAVGEGLLGAGASAEQIRQQAADKLLTGKQALSALGSGAGTAAFGVAGGKLAAKLGLDDIDTLLVGGAAQGGSKSVKDFAVRAAASGVSEGVFEEMPQSAQETMWMNYATDKPLLEGVPEAAAMGLVTGAAMGVGATAARGRRREEPTGIQTLAPEAAQQPTPPAAPTAVPQTPEEIDAFLEESKKARAERQKLLEDAGIASLAPEAPVAEEDLPAQDLDAMLKEVLAATGADINTVNMPEVAAAPVEAPKVEAAPMAEAPAAVETEAADQPPSTELIKEVLPKIGLSDKFGTLPMGEYSVQGTFEQDGRKWQVESLSPHSDGLVAQTIDKGEPVRRAFRFEEPVNPKLQELLEINNQLAKAGKAKELTYERLNEIVKERVSTGRGTADDFINRSIASGKDKLAQLKPAKPAPVAKAEPVAPVAPAAPKVYRGHRVGEEFKSADDGNLGAGFYTTESEQAAKEFASRNKNGTVLQGELKASRVLDLDKLSKQDFNEIVKEVCVLQRKTIEEKKAKIIANNLPT